MNGQFLKSGGLGTTEIMFVIIRLFQITSCPAFCMVGVTKAEIKKARVQL
jgi:hypothetical protein